MYASEELEIIMVKITYIREHLVFGKFVMYSRL